MVHGAGVYSAARGFPPYQPEHYPPFLSLADWAAKGVLALNINAHGIPNGREPEFYDELGGPGGALAGYTHRGKESRERLYFTGMCLRLLRAVDVLTAQPQWDGQKVAVIGVSQGGLQVTVTMPAQS
jgi:cephalosporin-C deacetylase-like acetyl esterase